MSDHHHSSSIQSSNKKSEETYEWKAKLRFFKENLENHIEKTDRKFDDFRNEIKTDMKALLTQMVVNQKKGKGKEEEKPRHRRNVDFDEHSER